MSGDALWYEAAQVVGITNALNVVADGLGGVLPPIEPATALPEVRAVFADLRDFYEMPAAGEIPTPFALAAYEPGYLADLWVTVRHTFADRQLSRRLKEALAFAVSLTSRSAFGTAFHLGEMRRLGVTDRGVMEVVGVTQMFSSYTKIADTLQLEPDMGDIAPEDSTPAPGGSGHVHAASGHVHAPLTAANGPVHAPRKTNARAAAPKRRPARATRAKR
jgi:alkylhydroperoxidase/carboxymuconolactone decarboxylase family protein YurZ